MNDVTVGAARRLVEAESDDRVKHLVVDQAYLLELIARGTPLVVVLDELVRVIEQQAPGMTCSVLLLSDDGRTVRHGSAPGLPEAYRRAVDGADIGPSAGSCGTAAYTRRQVVVTDIAADPLWAGYPQLVELALSAGLRACWSTPIFGTRGEVLGTFAIYYGDRAAPTAVHQDLIAIATHLAGIAIERDLADRVRDRLVQQVEDASAQKDELVATLEADAEAHRFLAKVSNDLAASLDLVATAETVVRLPVPAVADSAILWLLERDGASPRAWAADVASASAERVLALSRSATASVGRHASVVAAVETGRPVRTRSAGSGGWPLPLDRNLREPGEATFPLVARGRTLGTLTLFGYGARHLSSLPLAEELASRAALALENSLLFTSAERAVQARDEFLALASHELKTPLTPLRLSVHSLQRLVALDASPFPATLRENLAGAGRQVERLVELVDDLLDVSRMTASAVSLQVEPTDLGRVVEDVVGARRRELARMGCSVELQLEPGVVGRWDGARIRQAFTKLLQNAVMHAPGRILVSVRQRDGTALLCVRDEGPGISPENQARIFLPFERAVSYMHAGGIGLGLYLVRAIAEAHGGTVRLESAAGQGSAFTLELPVT